MTEARVAGAEAVHLWFLSSTSSTLRALSLKLEKA